MCVRACALVHVHEEEGSGVFLCEFHSHSFTPWTESITAVQMLPPPSVKTLFKKASPGKTEAALIFLE